MTTTLDTRIDRYTYQSNANGFADWLGQWKTLQTQGWDVQVLDAGDHAIGMAFRPQGAYAPAEQLELVI